MKQSIYFFKRLTPAEVGETGTKETYIRLSNDFDYLSFFGDLVNNNSNPIDAYFNVVNMTKGHEGEVEKLRFCHYRSGSHENRIPSLQDFFKKNDVKRGDVVCLERREEDEVKYFITFRPQAEFPLLTKEDQKKLNIKFDEGLSIKEDADYLTALQSKPFLILAGISGTGKSRIVRKFAFQTCPLKLQGKNGEPPMNYCMIEVKPNWHDSTELLGYYSSISGHYKASNLVRFIVNAMKHENVPYFVCLDEMNLAPVEQYFAEFLSVLETRRRKERNNSESVIITDPLIKSSELFRIKTIDNDTVIPFDNTKGTEEYNDNVFDSIRAELGLTKDENWLLKIIHEEGICIPENLFVIGTVNMDDTTYQFSRKVIDRAMTIEMNGGKLNSIFGKSSELDYSDKPTPLSAFKSIYLNADEVLSANESMVEVNETITIKLPEKLENINNFLKGTPFSVSYRVMNELAVYFGTLLDRRFASGEEKSIDKIVKEAVDDITMMKILPRIEGDDEMFKDDAHNKLEKLQSQFDPDTKSYKKLDDMIKRLGSGFTRFWP